MGSNDVVKARVTAEIKRDVVALAERELLSEAAWLKRLVMREIRAARGVEVAACRVQAVSPPAERRSEGCERPVFVRLRMEDRLLLDARAEARGMRPATYLSVLTRAHLRSVSPLPKEEYLLLKRSIAELVAVGRNINQITRSANGSGRVPASVREEFRAMLKVCEALRDNTRALLNANTNSWSTGYAETRL
jgi:hypothetical protein